LGAVASENKETSVPLIENDERRGPFLGLAPAEFLLAVLFILLIGLAGLLHYKQSQLDKAKRELDAVFSQAGQGRGIEQPSAASGSEPRGDARKLAEQTLRISALEAALNEARRERDTSRTEIAELRPLQAVADNASKIDPSQPPVQVLRRAVSVMQALGTTNDPARAVQDLKQQNEQLRQQLAANASELSQVSRENETLTRDARRERDAMQAELAELRPLKPLADAAAKVDPRQPAARVMQRALAVLESVGNGNADPARAVRDLKSENEDLRKRVAAVSGENDQLRREKDAAVRDTRQEREVLRSELSDLRPLKAVADSAAKIDPRQPPEALLQQGLAALQALGSAGGDPARAVQELRAGNEELKRKLAANSGNPDEALRARDEVIKENQVLRSELAGLQAFKPIAEAASKIAPGESPAAVVQRALSVMSSGTMPARDADAAATSLREENNELQRRLAALVDEKEKLQREKTALVRSGNLDFPSCWTNQQGETEFLLEVTIKDSAVIVRDIAPASRQSDANLRLLVRLPRNAEIRPDTFRAAVAPLYRWSVREKCRFFVQMQDGTSETSKEIYKKARQMVEGVFYVKHL
jgi:FtsZ-binding cell division protein ZapB